MESCIRLKLVSSTKRLVTRFIDYLFLLIISIIVMFLLLFFIIDWTIVSEDNNSYNHKLFSGLFMVGSLINFVFWFSYMILLPKFNGGRSLGCLLTRSKLYWDDDKKIFYRLIKHDGIVLGPIYLIIILTSIISFAFDNPIYFVINIFSLKAYENLDLSIQIASKIIFVLIFISSFIIVLIIINDLINNKKSTFLDDISAIYMLDLEKEENKSLDNEGCNIDLPGNIDIDKLEEA